MFTKFFSYKFRLVVTSNSRQLGASRQKRFDQVKTAYILKNTSLVKNKKIIIVDDVTTSGATLEFLAKTLKQAGAKSVSAVVFAQVLEVQLEKNIF